MNVADLKTTILNRVRPKGRRNRSVTANQTLLDALSTRLPPMSQDQEEQIIRMAECIRDARPNGSNSTRNNDPRDAHRRDLRGVSTGESSGVSFRGSRRPSRLGANVHWPSDVRDDQSEPSTSQRMNSRPNNVSTHGSRSQRDLLAQVSDLQAKNRDLEMKNAQLLADSAAQTINLMNTASSIIASMKNNIGQQASLHPLAEMNEMLVAEKEAAMNAKDELGSQLLTAEETNRALIDRITELEEGPNDHSLASQLLAAEEANRELSNKIAEFEAGLKCRVCFENDKDIVLIPCGHIMMCSECCTTHERMSDKCPLCSRQVLFRTRIYA